MVQELNNFITLKKDRSSALSAKAELLAESSSRGVQKPLTGGCLACAACCCLMATPAAKSRCTTAVYASH